MAPADSNASRQRFRALSFCLFLLLVASHARGAGLALTLEDSSGQPVPDAVVALLPAVVGDFRDRPTAIMDQRERQFAPYVLAVRTNTLVYFPNGDDIRHHVYSFSPAKRFELRLYHGTTAEPVLFDKAGEVVLGCNIHDAMIGYIYVVDSEWFAVSGPDGQVSLDGVPAGDYRLQVQHPRLAEAWYEPSLTLGGDRTVTRTLSLPELQPDPRQSEPISELERLFKR